MRERQWRGDYRVFPCAKCGDEVLTTAPLQKYCCPQCENAASSLRHYHRHRDRILAANRARRAARRVA